ncbi:hypothetical protein ACLB1E_32705 [Escherichia coli]
MPGFVASAGLYIKSRTVEAPVEPLSTQLAVSDAAAVTLPATVSAPPVTPAVVKSAFSTAQIDQWVAPVALYPLSAFTSVNGINLSANVAQAVQWSHDNPLKQGDAADFRRYLTSRGTPALNHWWPFDNLWR